MKVLLLLLPILLSPLLSSFSSPAFGAEEPGMVLEETAPQPSAHDESSCCRRRRRLGQRVLVSRLCSCLAARSHGDEAGTEAGVETETEIEPEPATSPEAIDEVHEVPSSSVASGLEPSASTATGDTPASTVDDVPKFQAEHHEMTPLNLERQTGQERTNRAIERAWMAVGGGTWSASTLQEHAASFGSADLSAIEDVARVAQMGPGALDRYLREAETQRVMDYLREPSTTPRRHRSYSFSHAARNADAHGLRTEPERSMRGEERLTLSELTVHHEQQQLQQQQQQQQQQEEEEEQGLEQQMRLADFRANLLARRMDWHL